MAGGLIIAAAATTVLVLSPIVLGSLNGRDRDWPYLADVGQAYGGVSAILSALALCSLGISLWVQQRQVRAERITAERQRHFDILRLALDDVELLAIIDPVAAQLPNWRQQIYANIVMGYWRATWQVGEMTDASVRINVGFMFAGPPGRRYWERIRGYWIAGSLPSARRFVAIVDDEWMKACRLYDHPPSEAAEESVTRGGVPRPRAGSEPSGDAGASPERGAGA